MDSHDVSRYRQSLAETLSGIKAKMLTIGIQTDILFPVNEQHFLAAHVPGGKCIVIESPYGHDGFLLEFHQLEKLITEFMPSNWKKKKEQEIFE